MTVLALLVGMGAGDLGPWEAFFPTLPVCKLDLVLHLSLSHFSISLSSLLLGLFLIYENACLICCCFLFFTHGYVYAISTYYVYIHI